MRSTDEAYMCFVCCKLERHVHGRNLSGCLEYEAVALATCDGHGFFHISFFFCVDHFICTETFCKGKSLIADIKNYDFLGAEDLCPLHGEHTNCSTAKDRHILATVIIILEYTVDSYCCRLKHCALLIRNIVCKWYSIFLRNYYIICIRSLLSGTDEAVMFAEGVITFLAVITFHTWKKRCTGYTVSDFYLCNTFSDFHNITGELMSKYDRIKMYAVV